MTNVNYHFVQNINKNHTQIFKPQNSQIKIIPENLNRILNQNTINNHNLNNLPGNIIDGKVKKNNINENSYKKLRELPLNQVNLLNLNKANIITNNGNNNQNNSNHETAPQNFNYTKNKFVVNFNPPNLNNPQDRIINFGQDKSENNFKKTLRKPAISTFLQQSSLNILNPSATSNYPNTFRGNNLNSNAFSPYPNKNLDVIENILYAAGGKNPNIINGNYNTVNNFQGNKNFIDENNENNNSNHNMNGYGSSPLYLNGKNMDNRKVQKNNSINDNSTNQIDNLINLGNLYNYQNNSSIKNKENNIYVNNAYSVKEISYKEDPNSKFRGAMEDTAKVIDKFQNNPDVGLFSLFDGHGGGEISLYLKNRLPELLAKIMSPLNSKYETDDLNYDIENILNLLFNKLDDEIKLTSESEYMGSTAVVVLICKEKDHISPLTSRKVIYTANVGDSRCVLISNFGIKRLSYDHKASDQQEIQRVNQSGGLIFNGRVYGQLIITRAFGDHSLKRHGVVAIPYISKHHINDKDKYVVIASDGVWDVILDEELLKLSQCVSNADELAKLIIKTALGRGTQDNVSCIVLKL